MALVSSARLYRVTEVFINGTIILDAEDDHPLQHRLVLEQHALPYAVERGAALLCHADGRLELASHAGALVPANSGTHTITADSPLLRDTLHACVSTVAEIANVPERVAAHIMHVWLQLEYHL